MVYSVPVKDVSRSFKDTQALKSTYHTKSVNCSQRATLLDQAKEMYHLKLTEGRSTGATSHDERTVPQEVATNTSQLVRGWALKQTKKSGHLSKTQKKYLNEKFSIGQQTGHKVDPLSVARNMPYAALRKKMEGSRLFTCDEFESEQQIQSYFSRQ